MLDCGDVVFGYGLGQPGTRVRLALGPGRLELVEAEPGHDRDQVRAHRFDRLGTPPQPSDASLLHDVLCVGRATQHAVRDAEEQ